MSIPWFSRPFLLLEIQIISRGRAPPFLFHTNFIPNPLKITLLAISPAKSSYPNRRYVGGKISLSRPLFLCSNSIPHSHSEDSPFRHLPDSHPDHSAAKPEPVQQRCLGTLVPDVVVVKVEETRRAAFQSLRHDLRQLPHAPVAKDFPPGRRSNPMFSVVENSGWETNPKHHYANNSFHVETIC